MNSTEQVAEWLKRVPEGQRLIIDALRQVMAEQLPNDAIESIYHDALGYGPVEHGSNRVMYIMLQRDHVNLGFFFGVYLDDPQNLLEGTGKRMRHVKILSVDQAKNLVVAKLVSQGWLDGLPRFGKLYAKTRTI